MFNPIRRAPPLELHEDLVLESFLQETFYKDSLLSLMSSIYSQKIFNWSAMRRGGSLETFLVAIFSVIDYWNATNLVRKFYAALFGYLA